MNKLYDQLREFADIAEAGGKPHWAAAMREAASRITWQPIETAPIPEFRQDKQMIADCEARESKLSDWERGFIDSIGDQLGAGKSLTDKQDETLTRIWERVT